MMQDLQNCYDFEYSFSSNEYMKECFKELVELKLKANHCDIILPFKKMNYKENLIGVTYLETENTFINNYCSVEMFYRDSLFIRITLLKQSKDINRDLICLIRNWVDNFSLVDNNQYPVII